MNLRPLLALILFSYTVSSCTQENKGNAAAHESYLDSTAFSTTLDGKEANLYTLKNKNGFTVYLTNFGARIVGILVPDKDDNFIDVALGFKNAANYNDEKEPYFGAIVGPVANRIAKGSFNINDQSFPLTINNGPNTLHGGKQGLHFANWETKVFSDSIQFSYMHPHLQDGFPGNKMITVTYSINDQNELILDYSATTDQDTYINLSNHTYFNLNGEGSGSILDHELQIFANTYTPVDSSLIPTGNRVTVAGNPFDFRTLKKIGHDINIDNEQLHFGKGYDHNFVLDPIESKDIKHAAKLFGDKSGIVLDIYSTEPGLQFYSGNFMNENVTLKNGMKDVFRTGLCLEPQNFPDSPNQSQFPTSELKENQIYKSKTIYSFSKK